MKITPYIPSTILPFVKHSRKGPNYWAIKRVKDYGEACDLGREYAAEYLEYLKLDPHNGLLGWIAKAVDGTDESASKGYAVGFFAFLDEVLRDYCRRNDHWKLYGEQVAIYSAIEFARRVERLTELEESEEDMR